MEHKNTNGQFDFLIGFLYYFQVLPKGQIIL